MSRLPAGRLSASLSLSVVITLGVTLLGGSSAEGTPAELSRSFPAATPRAGTGPDAAQGSTPETLDLSFGRPDAGRLRPPQRDSAGQSKGEAPPEPAPNGPAAVEPSVDTALATADRVNVIVRLREQAGPDELARLGREAAQTAEARAHAHLARRGIQAIERTRIAGEAADDARAQAVVTELKATSSRSRDRVQALLERQRADGHVRAVHPYWIFSGFAASVDRAGLDAIAAHPEVARVEMDDVHELPEPSAGTRPKLPTWPLELVNAPSVWGDYGVRGEGVVVGVMDGGVDGDHPALASRYRGRDGDHAHSWFVATDEDYPTPGDGDGHGTHVAGSAVGGGPGEVTGVAPGAEWIAAKIFDDAGDTSDSIIHAGFEWMLAPGGDPAMAPDVVNNSWGSDAGGRTEFWEDVQRWVDAGIVPVFANGNAGPEGGTVGSPASFPHAIGVGAVDENELVAWFSSRGPAIWDGEPLTKPNISAPGFDVYSAWPTELDEDGYHTISGTSMAAPHVTGVVALMLSSDPTLSIEDVRSLLTGTAHTAPHMGEVPNNGYGHGIVDAHAALTRMAHSGVVSGTVTGPDGPVAATVTVPGGVHGRAVAATTDPETGGYTLHVPEGTREIEVTSYGLLAQRRTVTVTPGETATVDFALERAPTHEVTGRVIGGGTGPDGPIDGARVELVEPGDAPDHRTHTDAEGRFGLTLPEGRYTLRVSAAGYHAERPAISVAGPTTVDVALSQVTRQGLPGWSEYQNNPARTGFAGDALAPATLRQDWARDLAGLVRFGSPVLAEGKVFLTTDNGRLHVLDDTTGETLWTFDAGTDLRSTPTVRDGVVYLGGGDDATLHALDADDGQELWAYHTGDERLSYATPAVRDGVVYLTTGWGAGNGGTVHAIDAATGEGLWTHHIGPQIFYGPLLAGDLLVAGSAEHGRLVGLDLATREERWEVVRTEDTFVAMPSYADGVVYAATTNFDTGVGSVLAIDASTGVVLWEATRNGDAQGNPPVVYDDLVIVGSHVNGVVTAYDRATGERRWRHALGVGAAVTAAQLVTSDGYLVGGSQIDRRVWALDAATGQLVWDEEMTANVVSAPAFDGDRLVVADLFGNVVAYRPTGTVAGAVTGPDGPVSASVRVVETGAEVTADPDTGAFVFELPAGTYTVEVDHYGFARETTQVRVRIGRETRADIMLASVGTGSVSGVVSDEDGSPVEGVTMTLAGTPLDATVTDAEGRFTFTDVAAGGYVLRADRPGWVAAETTVEVTAGEPATVELTLVRYEVAVLGDYGGAVTAELTAAGYLAEQATYAGVAERPGDYRVVVANGARDDPGAEVLRRFLDATDAAGTSVVWLDQWGSLWGAIDQLSRHIGDPAEMDYAENEGRVFLIARSEHPLTAGLPAGERIELLLPDSEYAAFTGYSGRALADLYTDERGVVGGGIGLAPRGTDSAHVLLPSHAVASTWGGPDRAWNPIARTLLRNAVAYGDKAAFGPVRGSITTGDGTPLAGARVEEPSTGIVATADTSGRYEILLEPGEHTLRFSRVGHTPVERSVTVAAPGGRTLDVTLASSGLGAVAGRVTSARGGGPLPDAEVEVAESGVPAVTAGPDGAYTVDQVPGGTYTVRISAEGFDPYTTEITVRDGETTTADAVLAPTPRVAVMGDHDVVDLLTGRGVPASEIGWSETDRLPDLDVVIFNDPNDPGRERFLSFLAAMDAASVSGIFPDDYSSFDGGARWLREYLGRPEDRVRIRDEGDIRFRATDPAHRLFAGLSGEPTMLRAGRRGSAIVGYPGFQLAEVVTETGGDRGVGAVYAARTPGSVHLLLGGFASTFFQEQSQDWTDDARALYLNAVRWSTTPGLGAVRGVVTGADGMPLVGAVVEVVGAGVHTTVGAEGTYAMALPPGTHTVRVSAYGYTPAEHEITVTGEDTTPLDVRLNPGAVGVVFGTVTGDGEPVAGARVRLLGTPKTTTTSADGFYGLTLVEEGDYELEVVADGHLRTHAAVQVTRGQASVANVALRASPRVGVIDDYRDRLKGYLTWWGYRAQDLDWDDTAAIAGLDLVVANLGNYPVDDPGEAGWRAFDDAANRAGVPVIWLDQFGRGSFGLLSRYAGTPDTVRQERGAGEVIARKVVDHPLLAGLPESFPLVEPEREHSWFEGFDGTTVATVSSEEGEGGLVGVRGRGARGVDILIGSLSVGPYGHPPYGEEAGQDWTPYAERLLRNALTWALDAPPLAGEVRGSVRDPAGVAVPDASVRVAETGLAYDADESGGFLVPLQPGTWTLTADAFGYRPSQVTVTVDAGEVINLGFTLEQDPLGGITGTIADESGVPLADAEVTVLDTPYVVRTGADGGFEIGDVPAGTWTLRVVRNGYLTAERQVRVAEGQTAAAEFALAVAPRIALAGDYRDALQSLLERGGYLVDAYSTSDLDEITAALGDYALVIVNDSVSNFYHDELASLVDAAAAARVSTVFTGQLGGGAIEDLQEIRGDPTAVDDGSVDGALAYVSAVEHPIFAGFRPGEPVELMRNPTAGEGQSYLAFSGYSGRTIANLVGGPPGNDLGGGVGYRFTSPDSVEVLLASLESSARGYPGERWTTDAERIFLNALRWSIEVTQGAVAGTVTSGGSPLAGATVTAVESGVSVRTGDNGRYRLWLDDGTHTVRVEAFGYAPAEHTVTVRETETVALDPTLERLPRGSVAGTVTAVDGPPLAGVTLSASGPQEWTATTGADGTYRVGDLLEGAYDVRVEAAGRLPVSASVTVTAGQVATLDAALRPFDIGVLGDPGGALTAFLRESGFAATALAWSDAPVLDGYRAVLVNGGSPTREQFDALLAAADAERVSLVFLGTWGVDRGGVRPLERYTSDVTVALHGYGDGPVSVFDFPADHPLFAGLSDPSEVIAEGGYYSMLGSYVGHHLAGLSVADADGGEPVRGLSIGYDWRSASHLHLVVSAGAVTPEVGPGLGWTPEGERLLLNAVGWAGDAVQETPEPPTLAAPAGPLRAETVEVSGTAPYRTTVRVLRDGVEVATAVPGRDGRWAASVPLVEGANPLAAVAANFAGPSRPSAPVVVVRDTTGPAVSWQSPAEAGGSFEEAVLVTGRVIDPSGVKAVTVGEVAASVGEDGSFSARVPLEEGVNALPLTARDLLGNETAETRKVLYLPWRTEWAAPPTGSRRGVPVSLFVYDDERDRPRQVDEVTLVATRAGGDARRHPMRWVGARYWKMVRDLPPGAYTLSAEVVVDGYTVPVAGPGLRVR